MGMMEAIKTGFKPTRPGFREVGIPRVVGRPRERERESVHTGASVSCRQARAGLHIAQARAELHLGARPQTNPKVPSLSQSS